MLYKSDFTKFLRTIISAFLIDIAMGLLYGYQSHSKTPRPEMFREMGGGEEDDFN